MLCVCSGSCVSAWASGDVEVGGAGDVSFQFFPEFLPRGKADLPHVYVVLISQFPGDFFPLHVVPAFVCQFVMLVVHVAAVFLVYRSR